MRPQRSVTLPAAALAILFALDLGLSVNAAPAPDSQARYYQEGRNLVHEIAGTVPAGAKRLKVDTQVGSVRLLRADGRLLTYRVRVRAAGPDMVEARRRLDQMVVSASREGDTVAFVGAVPKPDDPPRGLGAEFELSIPDDLDEVAVVTGAGDIRALGIPGRVTLKTRAGTIVAHDVEGALQAETRAGNIDAAGLGATARLLSAGGDVIVRDAVGDLVIRTSGGDVRVGRAGGSVEADTGGGGVTIEQSSGDVKVSSNGGDIEVGESGGAVAVATGGGGIRVGSAKRGVRCETNAGPITLDGIQGSIRALTSAGSIRALLQGRLPGDSDLQTWHGDVLVSLPESLPVTIQALVDNPVGQAIQSEFPLTIVRDTQSAGRPLETGEIRIGGGGPVLKLRTLGGRIVIRKVRLKESGNPKETGDSKDGGANDATTEERR
jgi:hypothetical protein